MASIPAVLLCAMSGVVLWMMVGNAIALRLPLTPTLRAGLAPALGWAVQTPLAMALSWNFGFSRLSIAASVVICLGMLSYARRDTDAAPAFTLPRWIFLGAALVALLPAAAILPKFVPGGVLLSDPIFDHSKIALIDQMVREGLPPANPIIGGVHGSGVAYYYLWHFGAAELARLTGSTGWEADAASTWFTAYACLCLMCAIAAQWSHRVMAPGFVLVASLAASIRPVLAGLFGEDRVEQVIMPATGLRGWLFQMTWSPHHMASACCSVLAVMLLTSLSQRRSLLTAVVLVLVLAAGFESSLWVGGVVFALVAGVITPVLAIRTDAANRWWFVRTVFGAALLAALLCAPLLREQAHVAALRGGGLPIALARPSVYWFVLLMVEFPVIVVAGGVYLMLRLREHRGLPQKSHDAQVLDVLALMLLVGVSLCGGWLLVSTAGSNNDLGWRAVLPAVLVLTAAAAAGFARWHSNRSTWAVLGMLLTLVVAAPESAQLIASEFHGLPSPSAGLFARSPELWQAVRRHTAVDWRVASSPLLFADMTPWAVNISWALLANRRSCYAGEELAIAFAPITTEDRAQTTDRFVRVFQGKAEDEDLAVLAKTFDCRVVVVTPQDGAWSQDPFASSPFYTLAEFQPDRWRIYVASAP
jgi:hypothetical protein